MKAFECKFFFRKEEDVKILEAQLEEEKARAASMMTEMVNIRVILQICFQ